MRLSRAKRAWSGRRQKAERGEANFGGKIAGKARVMEPGKEKVWGIRERSAGGGH